MHSSSWHLVIKLSVQLPSCFRFTFTTPLLKEKIDFGIRTLVADVNNPFFLTIFF